MVEFLNKFTTEITERTEIIDINNSVISVCSVVNRVFTSPSPQVLTKQPFNSVIYFFLNLAIMILDY